MNDETTKPGIDTSRVLDELSRNNSSRVNTKASRQRLRVMLILLFLSPFLLGIGYATFSQWQVQGQLADLELENQQLRSAQEASEAQLLSQLARLNNQLGDLSADTGNDEQLIARLQNELNSHLSGLNQSVDSVQRQLRQQQNRDAQWVYAEAEHMLRLADQKLKLDADVNSAIVLLSSVDAMLRDIEGRQLENSAVSILRSSIADDIRSLNAVVPVDLAGIYLRVARLADAVEQLSLVTSLRDAYQEQLQRDWQSTSTAPSGFIDSGLALLGSIFVWREWDEAPGEMLPPQEEYFVKQNLRLLMEQAQLSLLMQQELLFRESLGRGKDWLSKYQLNETEQGRIMLTEIDQLMLLRLHTVVPDIAMSLRLLRQLNMDLEI